MTSNSATHLATQQSIKAYVDANAGGGDLVLLSTATASSSSTIDITSSIDSTYDVYLVQLNNVVLSTNTTLYVRTSTNAGSTWDSGSTDYRYSFRGGVTASASGNGSTGAGSIVLQGNNQSSTEQLNGNFYLYPDRS